MSNFFGFQANGDKHVEQETVVHDEAPEKGDIFKGDDEKVSPYLVKLLEDGELEAAGVADDSSSVLNLRNLYRQHKIDKSQYVGGLATLVATGLITKSDFTRLKSAAN